MNKRCVADIVKRERKRPSLLKRTGQGVTASLKANESSTPSLYWKSCILLLTATHMKLSVQTCR
jgi:hypothetical protein